MRQFSIREAFGMQDSLQTQQRQQVNRDQARESAQQTVGRMFQQNRISPSVSGLLENAVAKLERCRIQDTNEFGEEVPNPITRTTLDLGVPDSMAHFPQRVGGFAISPEGRTDEKGRLMHYWDQELNGWLPIQYED